MQWRDWYIMPDREIAGGTISVSLPPNGMLGRALPFDDFARGEVLTLSVKHACETETSVRLQINWLAATGSIITTNIVQSRCTATEGMASVSGTRPAEAWTAFFYLVNDGKATARVSTSMSPCREFFKRLTR